MAIFEKKIGLLIACIFLSVIVFAQTKKVTGKVSGPDGTPLIGVTVLVKGLGIGTTTLQDGSFTTTVPEDGKTLVISYTGMENLEVPPTDKMNLRMRSKNAQLADVVVGYGTQKRRDLTGSIVTFLAKTYKDQPVLTTSSISCIVCGRFERTRRYYSAYKKTSMP